MPSGLQLEPDLACTQCGKFGAYAFEGEPLCGDCLQERGSCCAEREECPVKITAPTTGVIARPPEDRHRLNPNCCYQICPQCKSIGRLREFKAKYPHDWESRLSGSERILRVAQLVD
ncbi:MAG: hypothetical protein ABI273_07525 [Lacunisphaera sp.]